MIPEWLVTWIIDILAFFAVYLIVVVSLNYQYGYAGIPNFGLAYSVAGGAYVTGALAGRLAMWYYGVGAGLEYVADNSFITRMVNERLAHDPAGGMMLFLVLIVITMGINAILGFIASYPAIRLKADYLIMTLIAMAEAIRVVGMNYYPLVGATFWVHVPDFFAWTGEIRTYVVTGVMLGAALLMFFIIQVFATSPHGRLIRAIRENEVTAESVGKDVTGVKIRVIVIGSIIASLAGLFWSLYVQVVLSAAYTRTDWTFWPWLMLMVGGRGNNVGAAIGALAIIFARRLVIFYKHELEPYIPFSVIWLEQIMLGLVLILIMLFRPQGLIPEKPTKVRGIRDYGKIFEKVKSRISASRKDDE